MSRRVRLWLMVLGVAAVGACLSASFLRLPAFGGSHHPYRDAAVQAAVAHATPNVVSAVNFDQRGIDTLGEETIFLGSVIGASALLRPSRREREAGPLTTGRILEATRLLGYLLTPLSLILGVDLVTHGHITPGGGFQGGVVLATGIHLLYVAGSYQALQGVRPVRVFEAGEAVGAAAFTVIGLAGAITSAAFLGNVIPVGSFGQLFASGTVPLLSGAVGLEVASGVIVLLAKFLDQAILLGDDG